MLLSEFSKSLSFSYPHNTSALFADIFLMLYTVAYFLPHKFCSVIISSENIFEYGNHLYRFLDDDPLISRCQNIPRGISEVKPKPIAEISSRLRFLLSAMLEAYTSEDGQSVDYRSIHGSEEFARFVKIFPIIYCENNRAINMFFSV